MATRLVFLHGRAQEKKDAQSLKDEWIDCWRKGLAKRNLKQPVKDSEIRFPYYGDTLFDLVSGKAGDEVAAIVIKGPGMSPEDRAFLLAVLEEVRKVEGISDAEIDASGNEVVIEKGIANWERVQRILAAIDRRIPGGSAAAIALATNDVYQYLCNPVVTNDIDQGVHKAMWSGPVVVVSHSLGTVVAYRMLKEKGHALGWTVPLFVTLGSPLAITEIKKRLRPIVHPRCVGKWYNAMDERDVVSLYPLDKNNFDIDPAIENKTDVDNPTKNRHGISGYLGDADVAEQIYRALNP
jgi:hypothetical protein